MKKFMKTLLCSAGVICLMAALPGCDGSGPKKPLEAAANALKAKDSGQFLNQFDMKSYAAHEYVNLKENHQLLHKLDEIGGMLGLGSGLDELLNSVMDLENRTTKTMTRTVATGELVNQCTKAQTPDCPWVPEALSKAEIKNLGDTAAIAKVTTPANMTSWIALRKTGEDWKIVGKASLENDAASFANDVQPLPKTQAPSAQQK